MTCPLQVDESSSAVNMVSAVYLPCTSTLGATRAATTEDLRQTLNLRTFEICDLSDQICMAYINKLTMRLAGLATTRHLDR